MEPPNNDNGDEGSGDESDVSNESNGQVEGHEEDEEDDMDHFLKYPRKGIRIFYFNHGHFFSSNLLEKDSITQEKM